MPENELDYRVIGEKLRNGLSAAVNLIDRSFPGEMRTAFGLQPMLLVTTRNVQAVYQTITYICSEHDDAWRKLDFAVAALPLARIIADALSTVAFVLADPALYARWYWASGWREYKENFDRRRARNHPGEANWIAQQEAKCREAIEMWHIPAEWAEAPKKRIPWWPTMASSLSAVSTWSNAPSSGTSTTGSTGCFRPSRIRLLPVSAMGQYSCCSTRTSARRSLRGCDQMRSSSRPP